MHRFVGQGGDWSPAVRRRGRRVKLDALCVFATTDDQRLVWARRVRLLKTAHLVGEGKLRPVIDRGRFPLSEAKALRKNIF